MPTVTLDTNVLPADDLRSALKSKGFEFAVVTVTEMELGESSLKAELHNLGSVPETAVWDESRYGVGLYGGPPDDNRLERLLRTISNNSFPAPGGRSALTTGQRRQLRDAMILHAHVRDRRDIFVTNDVTAFVSNGRRERLETEFGIRIMTRDEFRTTYIATQAGA